MSFGTWYLTTSAGTKGVATGSLHPLGLIELERRLPSTPTDCSVIIDAGDISLGMASVDLLSSLISHVHNLGGRVVVVDGRGLLAGFLSDAGLSSWARVVPSVTSARELVRALAERAVPLAADAGPTRRSPAPAGVRATETGPTETGPTETGPTETGPTETGKVLPSPSIDERAHGGHSAPARWPWRHWRRALPVNTCSAQLSGKTTDKIVPAGRSHDRQRRLPLLPSSHGEAHRATTSREVGLGPDVEDRQFNYPGFRRRRPSRRAPATR